MTRAILRGALLLGLAGTMLPHPASAFMLNPPADKDAIKLRSDINKQSSSFSACLIKAAVKCEKKGTDVLVSECDLSDPAASLIADAPSKAKFIADVEKCKSKVDYNKANKIGDATAGFAAMGCPGDCDASPTTAPRGNCGDLTIWTSFVKTASPKTVHQVASGIPNLAGCFDTAENCATTDSGGCPVPADHTDPDFVKCISSKIGIIAKYVGAIQKCQTACETDYKDAKGNGGPTDASVCDWTDPITNPDFAACMDKAYATATKKGPLPKAVTAVIPLLVRPALNAGVNNLFNNADSCL